LPIGEACGEPFVQHDEAGNLNKWVIGG